MGAVLGFGFGTGNALNGLCATQHALTLLVRVETRCAAACTDPYRIGGLHRLDGHALYLFLIRASTNDKKQGNA